MARVSDEELSIDELHEGRLYVDRLLSIVPIPERDEVISILGQDIVEQNANLHQELCSLRSIWSDIISINEKQELKTSSLQFADSSGLNLVVEELKQHLEAIEGFAKNRKCCSSSLIHEALPNPRERHIAEDISQGTFSSRSSSRGSGSARRASRASSDRSRDIAFVPGDSLSLLNPQFDELLAQFRQGLERHSSAMQFEINDLLSDIEEEALSRQKMNSAPSFEDVKRVRSRLQTFCNSEQNFDAISRTAIEDAGHGRRRLGVLNSLSKKVLKKTRPTSNGRGHKSSKNLAEIAPAWSSPKPPNSPPPKLRALSPRKRWFNAQQTDRFPCHK